MNDEKRCRGCGRWPRVVQVEGAIDECNQPQNANVLRCAWRKQQALLSQQTSVEPGARDESSESGKAGGAPERIGETGKREDHAEVKEQPKTEEPPGHGRSHKHAEPSTPSELAKRAVESEPTPSDATIIVPTPTGTSPQAGPAGPTEPAEPAEPHVAARLYEKLAEQLKSVEAERERIVKNLHAEIAKHKQAFEDQLKSTDEARRETRDAATKHAALEDNMRGLESVFQTTRQQNSELQAKQATLRKENDSLLSQIAQARTEIESATRNVEQRVVAALRRRRMLMIGVGAAAGMMMGAAGGWLAHRPPVAVRHKTDALVMQIGSCLQSGDWECANNAAAGVLVLDRDNAVALVAQREVQVALAQAGKERTLGAEAARLAAAARAQRTPAPPRPEPVCPTATPPPPAASNDAVRAAILQQRKQFGAMLMSAAGTQLERGGLDCAVELASNAKRYDENNAAAADRIISQAQGLIRQGQTGVRVEDYKR
ncbi:hypothetical protein [Paraburkholderia sp. HP33-1]|uniref:hypothetical protein n=1 Tax=Paraburkholderia sp. HP33-1 TaxID=2883243 RepID=UPI001F20D395|nr:hypothetical protein [Paraburkholderia sp. HP33-1]